jgi:hypothetical protein
MSKQKKRKVGVERSYVSKLFETFFDCPELHVPSPKLEKYRNKICYSIPLPEPLSPLAQDNINEVCQLVAAHFESKCQLNNKYSGLLREVMVKETRDGSLMVRITVQKEAIADHNQDWGEMFVDYMRSKVPKLKCLCYNQAHGKARPTKDYDYLMLYGDTRTPYVMDTTPNGLSYQVGPDTFSEINPDCEILQYNQTKQWIEEYCSAATAAKQKQENVNAILLASGRDVSSFGLCFGSMKVRQVANEVKDARRVFSHVVVVQHCPLVQSDALANFERHRDTVPNISVLLKNKYEMSDAIRSVLQEQQQQQLSPQQPQSVVCVLTGGRKGLNPLYVQFLRETRAIGCIIYNSCSTKSLLRDMDGFVQGGFMVKDFKSYDFLPGTGYTASLTMLVRRPRTLILPVGPAGCGKSTLAKTLKAHIQGVRWWQRDAVFRSYRENGVGLNKTKHLVHTHLLEFLTPKTTNDDDNDDDDDRAILIVDSTNGNEDARRLYIQEAKPDRTVFVSLEPSSSGSDDQDVVLDFLMERTENRLDENNANHPSFPVTPEDQRKKHTNILKGLSYPTCAEEVEDKHHQRSFILSCDPRSDSELALLPFDLFLEFGTSYKLRQTVKSKLRAVTSIS